MLVAPWVALTRRMGRGLLIGSAVSSTVLVVSAVLFSIVEAGSDHVTWIGSGFVWMLRTLLEQASPWDIATQGGLVLYFVVLVAGVGLAAMVTGAIASKLLELFMRRDAGMGTAKVHDHIVICGWNQKGAEILNELHAREVMDKRPVVILADLPSSPTRDELTTFIRGDRSSPEDLSRAGIEHAESAIVLADDSNPSAAPDDIDAKTLLVALEIEGLNPRCHTCVEVLMSKNRHHFERTNADELVVSSELTGALLATAAQTHGISAVMSDLLTHPQGNEFYRVPASPGMIGMTFAGAIAELKDRFDCLAIAIANGPSDYEINPPADRVVVSGDAFLAIANADPTPKMTAKADRPRRVAATTS